MNKKLLAFTVLVLMGAAIYQYAIATTCGGKCINITKDDTKVKCGWLDQSIVHIDYQENEKCNGPMTVLQGCLDRKPYGPISIQRALYSKNGWSGWEIKCGGDISHWIADEDGPPDPNEYPGCTIHIREFSNCVAKTINPGIPDTDPNAFLCTWPGQK